MEEEEGGEGVEEEEGGEGVEEEEGGEGVEEEEEKFWLPLVFHGCFLHEERQRVISRKIFFAHQLLQIQLFLHAYSNSESKSYLRNAGSIATKRHNSN